MTANVVGNIPTPLLDRMEVIDFSSYTEDEKLQIAKKYLVPKQQRENGLTPQETRFSDSVLRHIIRDYTREAGVRALEKPSVQCAVSWRKNSLSSKHPIYPLQ